MAREVPIIFSSGLKEPKERWVKNRQHRWARDIVRGNSEEKDDVSEIVLYFNRDENMITQIMLMDSGLGKEDPEFSSNLDFEGQIRDLHGIIKKQEREIKKITHDRDLVMKKLDQCQKTKRPRGRPRKNEGN